MVLRGRWARVVAGSCASCSRIAAHRHGRRGNRYRGGVDVIGVVAAPRSADSARERIGVDATVVLFAPDSPLHAPCCSDSCPRFISPRTVCSERCVSRRDIVGAVGHTRVRGALLATQIALSVVLLRVRGLADSIVRKLNATDVGIRTDGLSVVTIDLPRARYQDIPQQVQFFDALLERVAARPGPRRGRNDGGADRQFVDMELRDRRTARDESQRTRGPAPCTS